MSGPGQPSDRGQGDLARPAEAEAPGQAGRGPGSDAELAVILDFLRRSAHIQREATRALTGHG
ncbi:hypothetical protein [Streptomyces sp. NPDC053367]|uniref:hypothetical protein n=1 Tax=Streptomyces sp. NPDC053367 TaxID=3365700 RepID=UPI0037D81617